MEGLILRFDAPLMSFGGVAVDHHGVIDRFPALSLFAGLIANALGYSHADAPQINELQDRLVVASRWDAEPEHVIDYHTVDLGQEKMRLPGWTTRGVTEHREGGPAARFGTHQRYRHYWANGIMTSALTVSEGSNPDLSAIELALKQPARPLFLGRKTCLPSGPILIGRASGENVLEILRAVSVADCSFRKATSPMPARWPAEIGAPSNETVKSVYDRRNWATQIHTGNRQVVDGFIEGPSCT